MRADNGAEGRSPRLVPGIDWCTKRFYFFFTPATFLQLFVFLYFVNVVFYFSIRHWANGWTKLIRVKVFFNAFKRFFPFFVTFLTFWIFFCNFLPLWYHEASGLRVKEAKLPWNWTHLSFQKSKSVHFRCPVNCSNMMFKRNLPYYVFVTLCNYTFSLCLPLVILFICVPKLTCCP